jgi:hypothetical protein
MWFLLNNPPFFYLLTGGLRVGSGTLADTDLDPTSLVISQGNLAFEALNRFWETRRWWREVVHYESFIVMITNEAQLVHLTLWTIAYNFIWSFWAHFTRCSKTQHLHPCISILFHWVWNVPFIPLEFPQRIRMGLCTRLRNIRLQMECQWASAAPSPSVQWWGTECTWGLVGLTHTVKTLKACTLHHKN